MLIVTLFIITLLCIVFYIIKTSNTSNKENITNTSSQSNSGDDSTRCEQLIDKLHQINGEFLSLIASRKEVPPFFDLDLSNDYLNSILPNDLIDSIKDYIDRINYNIEVYQKILKLSNKSEILMEENRLFLKYNINKHSDIENIIDNLSTIINFKQASLEAIAHYRLNLIINYNNFLRSIDIYLNQQLKISDILDSENYSEIKDSIETYDTVSNNNQSELSDACATIYNTLEAIKDGINLYLFECNLIVFIFNIKIDSGVDIKNTDRASASNYISHILIKVSNALQEFEKYSMLAHESLLKINDIKQLDHKSRLFKLLPFIAGVDSAAEGYISGTQKNIQFFKKKALEIRKKDRNHA